MSVYAIEGDFLFFRCPGCVHINAEDPIRKIQISTLKAYEDGESFTLKTPMCSCNTVSHIRPRVDNDTGQGHIRRILAKRMIDADLIAGVSGEILSAFSSQIESAYSDKDVWSDYSDMEKKIYAKPQVK